ncbi:hypothetical protein C5Y96_20585 [Blastopirellula marina]|uniref:Squalene cyclase C-terminal domain-containing protein n=1 Tax=Blastopirellula marina TaxID=124 RepID=A0A2S8F105_9BACT|nr:MULTISPECIES: prenyltransferase/squalene oxidase repeat-containing protein [Pirellulaceae]PQO25855.1 hypothetical protein C5Y96_20585 [Blastopirellula marina]RCS44211.1 hypothetical protein DTL36_20615 [Bremerella cremea]
MSQPTKPTRLVVVRCFVALGLVWGAVQSASALTPDSPEVQKVVKAASGYLATSGSHSRVGGKSVIALALLKSGTPQDHPQITGAVRACQKFAEEVPKYEGDVVYDAGLALIFLCELDPYTYNREIQNLVTFFIRNQRPHGGFGYAERQTGDNSMTQYAALGLWLAHENRFEVPLENIASLTNYIMSVQDPSGGFGYQGNVSQRGKPRVAQSDVRPSLTTAGLCSVYVSADALDLSNRRSKVANNLPAEFIEVTQDPRRESMTKARGLVDRQALHSVKQMGNQWMHQNAKVDGTRWPLYFLYALERFQAFKELDEGRPDPDPKWYAAGFEYIKSKQNGNGSIQAPDEGEPVGTAFAVLFLVRGTQETIKKHVRTFDNGLLAGGRGLPEDLAEAELRDGKVINVKDVPETDRFLELLKSDDGSLDNLVDTDVTFDMNLTGTEREIALQAVRGKLRQGSYAARLMAIRAIRDTKDFDSVPYLIFALSDPDPRIVIEARNTLRFISRKIDGVQMPLNPTPPERELAIKKWKEWYRSLRPDARFVEP